MKTTIKTGLLSLAICLALTSQSFARSWTLTPKSDVGFEIKSMGLTVVKAKFNQVQSTMQFDVKAPQNASTHLVMDVESLSFSKPLFKHMILGEDLFYVEKYKTVIFKSIQFKPATSMVQASPYPLFIRGIEVRVGIEQSNFIGTGLYLIGQLLSYFFGLRVSLNHFIKVILVDDTTGQELLICQPLNGFRKLV